jgi:hypothetical protein
MKEWLTVVFDPAQCRRELDQFAALLAAKQELSERDDLLPLFRSSPQLAAFIGTSFPNLGPADRVAFEFPVFGDFVADILIGNFESKTFCAIELEDARPNSVFGKGTGRATPEWGRRLERGFGQLVDWFFALDDHKNSAAFAKHFGYGHIDFFGMLLVGRSSDLAEHERTRLRWRSGRLSVNTHKVYCRTYDELCDSLNKDWRLRAMLSSGPGEAAGPGEPPR